TTFAVLCFAPSTSDPSLYLRTDTTLPPFYVLVYVDDLVFATADTEALAHVKSELQKRHTCTDLGELTSYLGLRITQDRAQRTIILTQSHMVQQVLQHFCFTYSSPQFTPLPTGHSLSAPPSDESIEPSGPYPELVGCLMYLMTCTRPDLAYPLSLLARYVAPGRHRKVHWDAAKRVFRYLCSTSGMGLVLGGRARVVLTGHADTSWVDGLATQWSLQGNTFSLGSGSVSWRSTCSSSVLSSSCEAEIYAGAMAAQELRWLTYLLTNLGEAPRSPLVLYVDIKAMLALCQEHRLEHRTKHFALRYFLARELQHRGQLRLAYVASQANTADVFTNALQPCDHQRFARTFPKSRKLPDGWRPGQPSIEGSKGVHGAVGEGMGSEEGDGGAGGHGGMFYHVGDACSEDVVVPASKVALHRSPHWVINIGAFMTMTNREDLQDEGVLLVRGLCVNLLFIKAFIKAWMKMEMIGRKVFKATLDGRVLWDLRGGKDMHQSMWEIPVLLWKEEVARLGAEGVRRGHASHIFSGGGGDGGLLVHGGGALPSLQQLFKEERVEGLRIKGEPKEVGSCETFLTSKFSKFPIHSAVGQSSDPVELVHVDLVGPMKVKGDGGALYSMTMVDDYTRLTWSFPLAKKSDAARVIIEEWLPMVERESGKKVKAIHSDRGREFLGAEFLSWLKRHGIKQQLTTAYTPQSNGVAERANRTIIEGGRTILVDSGLPLQIWPLAIRHATVVKNRVLTHVGGQHWVPMEKWSGKKPLVDMLRVFGCMGLVHVRKEKRDKLEAAAVWAVHLGLARGSKGWLMWDPKSNTIFTTRDAKFMEGLMFKEWSKRGTGKVTIPLGIDVETNDPILIPIELFSSSELTEVSHDLGGAEGEAADVEGVLQKGEDRVAERGDIEEVQKPTPSPKLPPRRTTQGKRDVVRGGAKEGAAKERPKRASFPRDFLKYEKLEVPKALLVQEEEDEEEKGAKGEMVHICCFGVNLPHESASMEEALAGDDREAWLASREDEL
ncbi:unnamed protein product, partial [Closterium sp. NIES-53]